MEIINRSRSAIEPQSRVIEESLANFTAYLTNFDAFSQQENDEAQVHLVSTANNLLSEENEADSDVVFEESPTLPAYSLLVTLISDNELILKQSQLLNKVCSWEKKYVQNKPRPHPLEGEQLHFLTDDAGCGNSFIMRLMHQSSTKTLFYKNALLDKPKH